MTVADVGVSKPVDSEELVGKKVCEMTVEATTESTPEKATETETPTEGMEVQENLNFNDSRNVSSMFCVSVFKYFRF